MRLKQTKDTQEVFRLRALLQPLHLWVFAGVLGLLTVLSVLGLLMISGWFLSATAFTSMLTFASQSLNYVVPVGLIRLLAVTRTIGRYAELMVSHNAIFSLLKVLRVTFFQTLAKEPLTSQHDTLESVQKMHRLISDINALNEFNLRVVMPWLLAIITLSLMALFIFLFLPTQAIGKVDIIGKTVVGLLLAMMIILPMILSYNSLHHSREYAKSLEKRRHALVTPLSIIPQLLMWKQWQTQTQSFIDHDQSIHQLDWQASQYKNRAVMVSQWLIYAVILLILTMTTIAITTHPNISTDLLTTDFLTNNLTNQLSNISDRNISAISVNIAMVLAMIFGLFGLQELILPLVTHYLSLGKAVASKERLNEMLTQPNQAKMRSSSSKLVLPKQIVNIQLTNLSAKLPNAIVGFHEVNAQVNVGTPMIISGASGCGKSTLLQTLANELTPASGSITLNGKLWQNYDWQDQLGYLGQRLDIFDQTLADNLRLGHPEATEEELIAVLDKVALSDWFGHLPQGLDTRLGEYGTAVSGGQARRVALARLLLKPRKVMLLDEPFAGLDKHTQSIVWQNIQAHQQQGILIIVSHQQTWCNLPNIDRLRL